MKKSLVLLAAFAAFAASAQTSTSGSASNSTSSPVINAGTTESSSTSASQSNPNNANAQYIQLNTFTPEKQSVDQQIHYSGTQTVKNVPALAMSGPASGPCTGSSGGLGVAGPGFGVGGNFAKVDDGCSLRENTRTLGQVFQALDGADPLKADARAALIEGMTALRNMNAKIAAEYAPPAPAPKTAAATPIMMPVVATSSGSCKGYGGTDPIVLARMGCK